MRISTTTGTIDAGWEDPLPAFDPDRTVILAFAAPEFRDEPALLEKVPIEFPGAVVVGCSTAGEVRGTNLEDGSVSLAMIEFDDTAARSAHAPVAEPTASFGAGRSIASKLATPDLRAVLVLSDGTTANGSELARGLRSAVGPDVTVTGGLAADGDRFEHTWVFVDGAVHTGTVAAVGLYGDRVRVGHGSQGGWDPFGPERRITSSDGAVLHSLDGEPALDLYRRYLGDEADGLPATALLFPLALRPPEGESASVVRTVLSVDEDQRSMTFAGDMPDGWRAQLMQANFDRIIDGAARAASRPSLDQADHGPSLYVAISCVGRRLVLGERAEEELEAVSEHLGPEDALAGFYSYGELSPLVDGGCQLHNQTMTLTSISER